MQGAADAAEALPHDIVPPRPGARDGAADEPKDPDTGPEVAM
jgi:hypothetical protein